MPVSKNLGQNIANLAIQGYLDAKKRMANEQLMRQEEAKNKAQSQFKIQQLAIDKINAEANALRAFTAEAKRLNPGIDIITKTGVKNGKEVVLGIDKATGKEIWYKELGKDAKIQPDGTIKFATFGGFASTLQIGDKGQITLVDTQKLPGTSGGGRGETIDDKRKKQLIKTKKAEEKAIANVFGALMGGESILDPMSAISGKTPEEFEFIKAGQYKDGVQEFNFFEVDDPFFGKPDTTKVGGIKIDIGRLSPEAGASRSEFERLGGDLNLLNRPAPVLAPQVKAFNPNTLTGVNKQAYEWAINPRSENWTQEKANAILSKIGAK